MFEMIDEQTNKVKFTGTEKQCLEFSMLNPKCKYIMREIKKEEKHNSDTSNYFTGTEIHESDTINY